MIKKIFVTGRKDFPVILNKLMVYDELSLDEKKLFQGKYIHIEELILEINDWTVAKDRSLFELLDGIDLLVQNILSLNSSRYNLSGYLIRSSWSGWVRRSGIFLRLNDFVRKEIFSYSVDLFDDDALVEYVVRKKDLLDLCLKDFYGAGDLEALFANIIACDVILTDLWAKSVAAKLVKEW